MFPGRTIRASLRRMRILGAVIGAAALFVVPVASAEGALVNTVTGKNTRLEVPFPTFVYLAGKHISVYPQAPATLSIAPGPKLLVTFPITGGTLVGNTNLGTINHAGSLTMVKTSDDYSTVVRTLRSADLKILNGTNVLASAHALDGTPVIGDIGVPAPVMDLRNVVRTRNADGSITLSADYVLNGVTTTILNTYFSTDAFTPGMVLGRGVSTITTSGGLL